jgi:DNA-binding response OmpR family regulator
VAAWLALTPRGRLRGLEQTGATIDQTASGAAFVRRLRDGRPTLAILVAPPAGSLEVLAVVSERRQRSTLRIVLLNHPSAVAQRLEALALGFDDALPWTIDPHELAGRIQLMLGGSRQPLVGTRHAPIAPGIELDRAAHRVTKDGADIHLRPKEFALLALLASDSGRVFSRDELVELVWGPRYRGSSRTVDVHIRWIRAKLEADPARPRHVVTVRGAGYRLDAGPDLDGR